MEHMGPAAATLHVAFTWPRVVQGAVPRIDCMCSRHSCEGPELHTLAQRAQRKRATEAVVRNDAFKLVSWKISIK